MIVRFDTPELAKKRMKELYEQRKTEAEKDIAEECWGSPEGNMIDVYYKEFFIRYMRFECEISVYCVLRRNLEELQSAMKMQSLMMEV